MRFVYRLREVSVALAAIPMALAVAAPPVPHSQDPSTGKTPLAFEVSTVKPDSPNKLITREIRVYPGGRLVIHGYTLRGLIMAAFDLPGWQVVSGDKWVDSSLFDIEGKPPEDLRNGIQGGEFSNAGIQDARVRSMLQTLLIERYHLKFHMERQAGTVYLLKRATGPLRLERAELNLYTQSEDGSFAPSSSYPTGDMGLASGSPVAINQTSMLQLTRLLSDLRRCPVSDETGLPGYYNFKSKTVLTDQDFNAGDPMHLLVDAVPELGLKLVKTEGVVEKFVLDNEEQPSAN
jgi:uncharacterized protein (TIGR03435 family)